MTKLIAFTIFVFIAVWVVNFLKKNTVGLKAETREELNPFEKKKFVFDIKTELDLYRILLEIFSDKYYIFPQMSYGRLMQVKKGFEAWNRNRFDKKIADFVLCEKEGAVAKLVIELDGTSHDSVKIIENDKKKDMWMKEIGLPILRIKTSNMDKEFVRQEVIKVL